MLCICVACTPMHFNKGNSLSYKLTLSILLANQTDQVLRRNRYMKHYTGYIKACKIRIF